MASKFTRSGNAEYTDNTEEGLENHGTELSQIPTYVTAVPNGTEKVGYISHTRINAVLLVRSRVFT